MSQFVWEVRTVGGDPAAVRVAVESAVTQLRASAPVEGLDADEVACWADAIAVAVSEPAIDADAASILVDVMLPDTSDANAPKLTGGFDTIISDLVIDVEGVTEVTCTDHIQRH